MAVKAACPGVSIKVIFFCELETEISIEKAESPL
jgi:hypothetical protein